MSEKVTGTEATEKRNLAKERRQYENIIDGYGTKNIDRFNMLSKYAEENMYCASELGDIYYYGDVFYSGSVEEKGKIERAYDKASYYYSLCSHEPNIVPNACWSLGYMILHKKSEESLNDVEREKRAIEYFERCGNYGPAKNSLANIYRGQGDKLYAQKFLSSDASEEDKKEVIDCYVKFINYAYEAHLFQWTYAKNALYAFLADEQYQPLLVALRKDPRYIHVEGIKLLQESATLGNVWAMDRLACHYIAEVIRKFHENGNACYVKTNYLLSVLKGECTVAKMSGANCAEFEETLKEAKNLLEEAHQQNYSRATFHLTLNFSRDSDECIELLDMAASRGEKQAKDKLKKFQA